MDRVFALLSLTTDEETADNPVDYQLASKSVQDRLVESSVVRTHKLDFLTCSDGPSCSDPHVPSWLLDWNLDSAAAPRSPRFGFKSLLFD